VKEIIVDSKISFKEVKEQIEVLKTQYVGILASFSYFDKRDRLLFIKQTKDKILGLENVLNWQKERIWETINGDFTIEEFMKLQ
jgi:hypothetical protein